MDSDDSSDITGFSRLHDPALNKSTAFTPDERERFGLRGLLPASIGSQPVQIDRVLGNLRRKASDIERYIFMAALQARNERLFYKTLIEHIEQLMPIVYTPTVGRACREFAHIFRQSRGFYITSDDRGEVARILKNWPHSDVRVVVVTDGERILGLGDLGANGMGIPIGKLALYTACAGIPPEQCLPVQIDVGTDNERFLGDPLYLGCGHKRIRGDAYFELMDEFMEAVGEVFPGVLVQFEDFLTPNAYGLLRRYRDNYLCFNDDIQGTAAVALAGVSASTRIIDTAFRDLRIMFLGAGSAATGIGDLMAEAFVAEGLDREQACSRLWFVDVNGLVVRGREDLMPHNEPYAHAQPPMEFVEAIATIKPHVLIGATGFPATFTEEVVRKMAELNERPVIFALSNPTSRAECTAEQAHAWSDGRVVFASGSPFLPVDSPDGTTWRPAQGNNAYVFPGVGLGVIGCEAERVTEEMFLAAAGALAGEVSEENLSDGALYPPLHQIRSVSLAIGTAVAEVAYRQELARLPRPASIRDHLESLMYDPTY